MAHRSFTFDRIIDVVIKTIYNCTKRNKSKTTNNLGGGNMKTERNIMVAFLLNVFFSIFELIGGIFTNSVAIVSDAIHDLGDAISIGFAYLLEKKSKKKPDDKYTYGYIRYSVLGALITNTILIIGSIIVVYNAVLRIINPAQINYDGMIIFAIVGAAINFIAAYFTRDGNSLNQKAVNLHMLEDVLGWLVVLIGALIMKFTNFAIIDPVLSILVASFILVNALKSYKTIIDLFLVKIPSEISIDEVKKAVLNVENIKDVHHIHVWSMDGSNNYATMHIVADNGDLKSLKIKIKDALEKLGVFHTTIEFENSDEICTSKECYVNYKISTGCSHHHHYYSKSRRVQCNDLCCNEIVSSGLIKDSRRKYKKYWYNPSKYE